jgi:REP element-mobilizing transposase RayT
MPTGRVKIPSMARSIRLEYAGAFYHVMARGNRKNEIFVDDDDRRFFLKCLSEVCEKTGWKVHAWVLMPNHYHLFIGFFAIFSGRQGFLACQR